VRFISRVTSNRSYYCVVLPMKNSDLLDLLIFESEFQEKITKKSFFHINIESIAVLRKYVGKIYRLNVIDRELIDFHNSAGERMTLLYNDIDDWEINRVSDNHLVAKS